MEDQNPSRRSMLSYLTGGGVAVGALVAGGGLMRSCAPTQNHLTPFDMTSFEDGDVYLYLVANQPVIIAPQDDQLAVWDAYCPFSPGWVLLYDSAQDGYWCQHCTRRYNRAGQWTDRNGALQSGRSADNLQPVDLPLIDGVLMVPDTDSLPRLLQKMT